MDRQIAHWQTQQQEQQQQSQQEEPSTEALQAQMCLKTEQHSLITEEQQQGQRSQQQSAQEQLRDAEAAAPAVQLSAASNTAAQAVHACASVPGDQPSIISSGSSTSLQAPRDPQQYLHTGSRVSAEAMVALPSEGSNSAQGESSSSTLLPSSSSSMKHDPRSSNSRRPHSAPESTSLPAASGGTSSIPGTSSSSGASTSSSRNTGTQDSKPAAGEGPSLQRKSGGRTSPSGHFLKPLFVPIVVCMDEADHTMIAEEALGHQLAASSSSRGPLGGASGSAAGSNASGGGPLPELSLGAGSGPNSSNTAVKHGAAAGGGGCGGGTAGGVIDTEQVREAIRKARVLQDYLCVYEGQGLPVVRVSYGNFGEALDKLHEYILQCIKVAMQL